MLRLLIHALISVVGSQRVARCLVWLLYEVLGNNDRAYDAATIKALVSISNDIRKAMRSCQETLENVAKKYGATQFVYEMRWAFAGLDEKEEQKQ